MAIRRKKDDFPAADADLGGPYARDTHQGGYGDDYAREGAAGGTGARGDTYGSAVPRRRKVRAAATRTKKPSR